MAVPGGSGAVSEIDTNFDFRGERIVAETAFVPLLEGDTEDVARSAAQNSLRAESDETDIHGHHDDVSRTHDHARQDQDRVDGYTRLAAVTGGELNESVIGNEARIGGSSDGNSAQERRARRNARDFTDQLLMAQLAEIDGQIAHYQDLIDKNNAEIKANNARIGELGDDLKALDTLEDLAARGELDPGNPEHARLLAQAGINPEDINKDNAAETLSKRRREMDGLIADLENRNTVLMQENEGYEREKGRLEADKADLERRYAEAAPENKEAVVQEFVASRSHQEADYAATMTDDAELKDQTREEQGFDLSRRNKLATQEEVGSTADFGFLEEDPPPRTASVAGETSPTPINDGEGIQMAFARAHDGESLPPGVEPETPTLKVADADSSMTFQIGQT